MASNNFISQYRNRVQAFSDSMFDIIQAAVMDNEQAILSWNADTQLYERGETREGIDISSYMPYTPLTVLIKKAKGQPYNRVTLRDTGGFENSFYLDFTSDGFRIYAGDSKTDELTDKYGEEILGLTDEHFDKLLAAVYEFIMEVARKQLL